MVFVASDVNEMATVLISFVRFWTTKHLRDKIEGVPSFGWEFSNPSKFVY